MANTIIQIKRSQATAAPTTLQIGEMAYSYSSNTLYIGNTGGTGVIAIGGASLGVGANAYAAAVGVSANSYAAAVGVSANSFASAVGVSANAYAAAVGVSANSYSAAVGVSANSYAAAVGVSANSYAAAAAVSANAYAVTVGTAGNNYTVSVGAASNTWANNVGVSANAYAVLVGAASNNWANVTFYSKNGGTISGDVLVTGNVIISKDLNVTGNVTFTNTKTLIVSDPLLYLAGNNYTSDVVDIGFVANYVNATSVNVHTGLYRSSISKQYYLFQGYNKEPDQNYIDFAGNNFTLAVLNSDIITSNLFLGGVNAIPWIVSAFDKANSANVLAFNTGIGANAYAAAVGVSANSYAAAVGVSANSYAAAAAVSANAFATTIGASSNAWANTKVSSVTGTAGQIFSSGGTTPTLNLIPTAVTATTYGGTAQVPVFTVDTFGRLTFAANVSIASMDYAYVNTAANNANSYAAAVGVSANSYAAAVGVSANSYAAAVGVSANSYAALVAGYANTNASNGSYISTGVVRVAYGGTGNTTFLANSVLIGAGANAIWGLQSTTEGHLLQISSAGAPQFAMLDGGSF